MIGWGCNIGWNAVSGSQLSCCHNATDKELEAEELASEAGLQLNHEEISWMGASFSVGGLCGALSAGKLM